MGSELLIIAGGYGVLGAGAPRRAASRDWNAARARSASALRPACAYARASASWMAGYLRLQGRGPLQLPDAPLEVARGGERATEHQVGHEEAGRQSRRLLRGCDRLRLAAAGQEPERELDPGQHVVREQLDLLAVLVERLGRALLGQHQAAAVVQVALRGDASGSAPRTAARPARGGARGARSTPPPPDGRAARSASGMEPGRSGRRSRTRPHERSISGEGGWNWRISRSGSMARSNSPFCVSSSAWWNRTARPSSSCAGRPSARARARCSRAPA